MKNNRKMNIQRLNIHKKRGRIIFKYILREFYFPAMEIQVRRVF